MARERQVILPAVQQGKREQRRRQPSDRIIKACADKICEDEDFVQKARTNSMGDLRAIFGDVMMRALAAILSDSADMY